MHFFQATEVGTHIKPAPSAVTEVTVIVTDVNDEAPTFRSAAYECEIPENAQVNTPLTFIGNAIPEVFDYDQVCNFFSGKTLAHVPKSKSPTLFSFSSISSLSYYILNIIFCLYFYEFLPLITTNNRKLNIPYFFDKN